jgi:hypothetical protein
MLTASALVSLTLGGWQVSFDEEKSALALAHAGGQVSLRGSLSFTSDRKPWRIVAPRDAVADRIALVDGDGDLRGYVSFQANGERLSLLVYHRTAQSYPGELGFTGDLRFRGRIQRRRLRDDHQPGVAGRPVRDPLEVTSPPPVREEARA